MFAPDATLRSPSPSQLRRFSPGVVALTRSPNVCAASRAIIGAAAQALAKCLEARVEVTTRLLEAAVDPADLRDGCCFVVLSFANSGDRALLEVENATATALVDQLSGGCEALVIPAPVTLAEAASVAFLALAVVQAARACDPIETAWAVRFSRVARDRRELRGNEVGPGPFVAFDVQLQVASTRGAARLLVPSAAVLRLCSQCANPAASMDPGGSVISATLPARLRAVGAKLTPEDLASLAVGDAIVLESIRRSGDDIAGPAWLAFEHFELRGSVGSCAFHLAEIVDAFPLEVRMDTAAPPPLPVSVEVELARVRVPLAQLGLLRPGAVMPLDVALTDPVTLRIGDRAVARAELVDIDGELGARIVALLP